ncbi:hypothetical protein JTB14_020684 [Gonioctena quinquepunctata]|nr:hypothetical protein JTB14_020684 [Gonioctena quinquepunctata]
MKGQRGKKSTTFGRFIVFTVDEEQSIAQSLMEMEKHGFGLSMLEISDLTQGYVKQEVKVTPFGSERPTSDLLTKFLKKSQSVEIQTRNCVD